MANKENNKVFSVLADAIGDTGNWIYWEEDLPSVFQLEFNGVQLYNPPLNDGDPPSSTMALCFEKPLNIIFLTFDDQIPDNWPQLMKSEKVSSGRGCSIWFNDRKNIAQALDLAKQKQSHWGSWDEFFEAPYFCLVKSGATGLYITAENLIWRTHKEKLELPEVIQRNKQWWEYLKKYWAAKKTADPLPYDSTCELTIPIKE